MKNKTIPASMIEVLADKYIYQAAEEENAGLRHALKNISRSQLENIFRAKKAKVIPIRSVIRERFIWAASIAALFIIAFSVSIYTASVAENKGIQIGKCEMLYAYNINQIPNLSLGSRGSEELIIPDIVTMSNKEVISKIPTLIKLFDESEELQEVDINGRILALAYLKIGDAEGAKSTFTNMKKRLTEGPVDYEETIVWIDNILSKLE